MNILVTTLARLFFDCIFLILSDNKNNQKISDGFKICQIRPPAAELAAPERLEKYPYNFDCRNIVTILVPSFLNESSELLQLIRTTIKA